MTKRIVTLLATLFVVAQMSPADGQVPDDGGTHLDDGGRHPDDDGRHPDDGGRHPDDDDRLSLIHI